jgi:phosphohistidine phosphatase
VRLFLVHHADAVGPEIDPQRPLSPRGRNQAQTLAARAETAGAKPAIIWHSGKLRARQTAEAFLRANSFAEFHMVRGLRPEDSPELILTMLAPEDRDVLVVSHWPLLPALAHRLGLAEPFPLHGLVALERGADGTYVELWRVMSEG